MSFSRIKSLRNRINLKDKLAFSPFFFFFFFFCGYNRNRVLPARVLLDCRSVDGDYIARASRSLCVHFATDLQPVICWAADQCKQESISKHYYAL